MALKIIQILHHSPSWTSQDLSDDIYNGWHVQVAKAISKLNFTNCQIECWLPEKTSHKEFTIKQDNIVYRIFPSKALSYGRESSPALINALHQEKQYQIMLHIHGIFNQLTYNIADNFKPIPIIAQHHGDCPPLSLLSRRKLLYTILPILAYENYLCYKTLPNLDYFFCLTNTCQQSLRRYGINDKTSIQTMGVDFTKFVPADKIQTRAKLGLSLNGKIILYVGRLDQYKASDKVISTYNELKKHLPIQCLVVGAQQTDQYYDLAQQSGCQIIPRQPHDSLIQYYQSADVLVLPGSDEYNKWGGIGVNVIEALACDTPVVSGTLKHFPEDNSKLGVLASDSAQIINGINYILNNPTHFTHCREIAQKYYDWQKIAWQTYAIYQKLFIEYYNTKLELHYD